ncbi:hypothetical protein [Streptomyces scopuliridis]|uniref:hypothetical protein n=1 Tax=Streptomyces scopuliridis TaxID=452529 RepID=UPI0036755D98
MSDRLASSGSIGSIRASAITSATLTAGEVDKILLAMAEAADALLQEHEVEQRRMEKLNEHSESLIAQRNKGLGSAHAPGTVLSSVRLRLAIRSAKQHRDAAHEFVSWWADAATVAWMAAVAGAPVSRVRLIGADPESLLDDDDLAALPPVDEQTRRLVELSARLDSANVARSPATAHGAGQDDLTTAATDLAARHGLRIEVSEAHELKAVDGVWPEDRRRRLWGDFWLEHRIPLLPVPDDLPALLSRMPPEIATRLRAATRAVFQAVVARIRTDEIEATEGPWTGEQIDEYEALSRQEDSLTAWLADYARAVTESLPVIRATHSGQ